MRLARVTGSVTATLKEARLTGLKLLLTDVVDGQGEVLEGGVVAVDCCGAGPGDMVLLAQGSAARLAGSLGSAPVDCAAVAVVDSVAIAEKA